VECAGFVSDVGSVVVDDRRIRLGPASASGVGVSTFILSLFGEEEVPVWRSSSVIWRGVERGRKA
jgi:hypothetical protein